MRRPALFQSDLASYDPRSLPEEPRVSNQPRMAARVSRLTLTDFRNYRSLKLEAGPGPIVLTGPNGAGKTNLLEALSLLSPGRGLRRARLTEIARQDGPGGWAVAATIQGPNDETRVGTGLAPATGPGGPGGPGGPDGPGRPDRRQVRVDGRDAPGPAALGRVVALLWLTPRMDRLFLDGAGARRRFVDRLVFGYDADHARRVSAYEKAMRERARLLRAGPADAAWGAALETIMAEQGVAVAAARRDWMARLNEALGQGIGPFPAARIGLVGTVEDWLAEAPAAAVEDRVRAALAAGRRADAEQGRTALGPHRTDLAVHHVARDRVAARCSTGEQKALLIALVLADARLTELERGQAPILLLDEVAAHLDAAHRAALYDELIALGCQAWLSGTDPDLFTGLGGRATFVGVRDAALYPMTGPR